MRDVASKQEITMGCGCSDKTKSASLPDNTMDASYWDKRYEQGIGAGAGSKGRLAAFKLKAVQDIVDAYDIKSVADVGCGDGAQMRNLRVKQYRGFDVSEVAIDLATAGAKIQPPDWMYQVMSEDAVSESGIVDMAMSIDVLFHLDETMYKRHLDMLFHLSRRYVLIYAPNHDGKGLELASHMFFREFVPTVKELFKLDPVLHVENEFPPEPVKGRVKSDTSFADFYLFDLESKKRRTKDDIDGKNKDRGTQ